MATRLKTVEFCFPTLASLTEASETNLTQITVYIPESSPSFKKVIARWTLNDIETSGGSTITEIRTLLQLGSAGYTTVTNTTDFSHSGESISLWISADFTSHFTANWTGTSMTCDAKVYADQTTPTTSGFVDVCMTLEITYEYDDTSSTHIVTHRIPLDEVLGVAATSKPGTAVATIPALDTYCPEASKTYRDCWIEVDWLGSDGSGGTTTDQTASWEIDSAGSYTTSNHERGLATDRLWLYRWRCMSGGSPTFTTNSTHSFYLWATAQNHVVHPCLTLVVTYEFSPGSSTTILNSVRVPFRPVLVLGDNNVNDPSIERVADDFFIEEPTTITEANCALRLSYSPGTYDSTVKVAAGSNLTTPTWTSFTGSQQALTSGGMLQLQHRVNSGLALARGRNVLRFGIAQDSGVSYQIMPISGYWLLNYTSGKATAGVGAHNHTVIWNVENHGTGAAGVVVNALMVEPTIPESSYFVNGFGTACVSLPMFTWVDTGYWFYGAVPARVTAEGRASMEGDLVPSRALTGDIGTIVTYADFKNYFVGWPNDPRANSDAAYDSRMGVETSRTWKWLGGISSSGYCRVTTDLWITYHAITFSKTTTVAASGGGTVNLTLYRKGPPVEAVLTASRSGNGTVAWTWYDDTETMFVEAREDATHVGRSNDFTFA